MLAGSEKAVALQDWLMLLSTRTLIAIIGASILLIYSNAAKSDPLKDFGLDGTWSAYCGRNPNTDSGAFRMTFEVPWVGASKFTMTINRGAGAVTVKDETRDPVLITANKIRLNIFPTDGGDRPPLQMVIERVGSRIRDFDIRNLDGSFISTMNGAAYPSGVPEPLLEKCLN